MARVAAALGSFLLAGNFQRAHKGPVGRCRALKEAGGYRWGGEGVGVPGTP